MTIESSGLNNRFHFDLSARFSRSIEREYSGSSSPVNSNERASRNEGFYSRANSVNVLERALTDGLGKQIDLETGRRDVSPARAIAKNVLSFVRQELREARNGGASEQELQGLLNQAREGIEKGFSSARDALQGRYNYEPRLERQIERAFEKIQRGLERLDNRYSPNLDASAASDALSAGTVSGNEDKVAVSQQPNSPVQLQQIEFSQNEKCAAFK